MVRVGEIIRNKRTEAGFFSLRKFAQKCSISPSYLSDIELGKSNPSLATLNLIAVNLGVSVKEFFDNENPTLPSGNHVKKEALSTTTEL